MSGYWHYTVPPFYFSIGATAISSLVYIYQVQGVQTSAVYTPLGIFMISMISILTLFGQLLQGLAYEYEKASRVAVFYYLQVFLVFLQGKVFALINPYLSYLDMIFFHTKVGGIEIIGATLIICWNVAVGMLKLFRYIQ